MDSCIPACECRLHCNPVDSCTDSRLVQLYYSLVNNQIVGTCKAVISFDCGIPPLRLKRRSLALPSLPELKLTLPAQASLSLYFTNIELDVRNVDVSMSPCLGVSEANAFSNGLQTCIGITHMDSGQQKQLVSGLVACTIGIWPCQMYP
eukprot:1161722-Pelagomonas_calceolata.AAC.3